MKYPGASSGRSKVTPFRTDSIRRPPKGSGLPGTRDGMYRDGMGSGNRFLPELPSPPEGTTATTAATEAWATVMARLEQRLLPVSRMWISPLTVAGEFDNTLVLTGPAPVVSWVRRRYAPVIGDECRRVGFAGVRICLEPYVRDERQVA